MRLLAIVILLSMTVTSMIPRSDVRELQRFAGLAQHYVHHVVDHGDSGNVLAFVWEHLASNQPDAEHNDLPILGGTLVTSAPPYVTSRAVEVPAIPCSYAVIHITAQERCPALSFTGAVFHPPRKRTV